MKEPNVLEAIDLCVNGNPVDRPVFSDSEVYRNVCLFQPTSREFLGLSRAINKLASLWKDIELMPKPNYEKGSHETRPIGEDPEPIIIPEPRNPPAPPPFRTIHGKKYFETDQPIGFMELKDDYHRKKAEINAKYDREQATIQRRQCIGDKKKAKKSIVKKSWLSKFKNWLKDLFIDDYEKAMKEHSKNMSFLNDRIPEPRNSPKPPPARTIKGSIKPYENVKVDCLSGNYKKATFGYLVKAFIGKSWIDKLKKFFKGFIDFMTSDIGRHNPYDRMIKFPGHRNPPPPPERVMSNGEITKNMECEELSATTPFTKHQFICAYNLLIPHLSHSTIKHKLNRVAIMCMRKNMDFDESVRRYAIICQDIIKLKNKHLQILRRRRKKRYSISTPITRKC